MPRLIAAKRPNKSKASGISVRSGGEAGRDQRSDQLLGIRYLDRLAVQGGAAAMFCDIRLFPHWVMYHPKDHLTGPLKCYGDAEDGQTVSIVGGAIQRIHDPAGILLSRELSSLLCQHPVGGEGSQQLLPYHQLCFLVDLRDEIHLPFVGDRVLGAEARAQHLSCLLGCRERGLKFASQKSSISSCECKYGQC